MGATLELRDGRRVRREDGTWQRVDDVILRRQLEIIASDVEETGGYVPDRDLAVVQEAAARLGGRVVDVDPPPEYVPDYLKY
jgi:hypothetical protein